MKVEWKDMNSFPKSYKENKTWVIVEVEIGGDVFEAALGRWNPKKFGGLGIYDWETLHLGLPNYSYLSGDDTFKETEVKYNNYSDGRISGWCDIPTGEIDES